MRFFFAGAANCEVDKQGRILLPANLREYAGIDKEVVSVGVFSHLNKVTEILHSKVAHLVSNRHTRQGAVAENSLTGLVPVEPRFHITLTERTVF